MQNLSTYLKRSRFLLKTSRPGLWFATVWLYMLPTAQINGIFDSWVFWVGLFYVCFPLNLLVYGWNDLVDRDADRMNPRKGNFLFGAVGTDEELRHITVPLVLWQCAFFALFVALSGLKMLAILLLLIAVLWAYNHPTNGLRSRPPFELACQFGYLLVVPMSAWLNDGHVLSPWAMIYLALFAMQSHLMGEVMDIDPDKKAGKKTTATQLGRIRTKWIIIALVIAEVAIIHFVFEDMVFAGMLVAGLIWLFIDLFVVFRSSTYTLGQMKLFGYGSNAIGYASMMYVWWSGCLLI